MQPKRAASILSLSLTDVTPETISAAFKDAVRAAHPDNGGDPELAPQQLRLAREARDTLTQYAATAKNGCRECPACKGKGRFASRGFKPVICGRCKGEGHLED